MLSDLTPAKRPLPAQLLGPRLRVRPYQAGDGAALFEAVDEDRAHLGRWLPWVGAHTGPGASEEAARRMGERWQSREDLTVGVWERGGRRLPGGGERLLGGSGLHRCCWDVPSFEIGYWLRGSAQGQGYMTEAVGLLCRLAFGTLDAQRVVIRCDRENVRSAAVAHRLGFVHEATLRNDARDKQGRLRDTLLFSLTPDDAGPGADGDADVLVW